MSTRSFVLLVGISLLVGCSGPGTADEIVARAIAIQGGQAQLEAVNSIVRRGSGTGAMVGQVPTPDAAPPSAELTNYTEAIDFVNGRTMVDYDLTFGAFQQHRREVLTDYGAGADALTVGYQMANDQGAVVSPNALLSFATPYHTPQLASARDPITVLFRASVDTESSMQVVLEREFNGIDCLRFQIDLMGRTAELFFDPDTNLMVGYLVFETDPYLGDVETAYIFDDYRDVDGLLLPHEMWVQQGWPRSGAHDLRLDRNQPGSSGSGLHGARGDGRRCRDRDSAGLRSVGAEPSECRCLPCRRFFAPQPGYRVPRLHRSC